MLPLEISCLSGSHCTGKTSILRALEKEFSKDRYLVVSESNTTDIKTLQNIDRLSIQLMILMREQSTLLELLIKYSGSSSRTILKDRGALDTLIYSEYFKLRGLITEEQYRLIESACSEIINQYKYIFITTTEHIPFIEREKYSMDEQSRIELNSLFVAYYENRLTTMKPTLALLNQPTLEGRVSIIKSLIFKTYGHNN